MSPAATRRFLVKCFDYEEWGVIVEATSREDAIRKGEAIYLTDSLGSIDGFELIRSESHWSAQPLIQEVC
ncbi:MULTISPECIES: hypothetical protein [Bradyrhizobium]|uniref:Uncharacterized protein n=1 Tax=Bradyrhizobium frederickii TaxID=2560054 RepID=A0A4Y9NQT4_9BRAD|nr:MULTISPECIES: hypothetical protein [Bradyrhizobium]RTE88412.1 hypothetical protein D6B98_35955 [Bradyrhizobium sp. LVM 105]TFV30154.1 hypothetical protein E4K66_36665 [Bradyrhizobium frederickii]TFV70231.1 hypothetical protein E4K64_30720 [Bradyrhizobium frederickii]